MKMGDAESSGALSGLQRSGRGTPPSGQEPSSMFDPAGQVEPFSFRPASPVFIYPSLIFCRFCSLSVGSIAINEEKKEKEKKTRQSDFEFNHWHPRNAATVVQTELSQMYFHPLEAKSFLIRHTQG